MPRIFKHRGVFYLDLSINGQRIRKSLHTQNKKTALKVSKILEYQIIQDSMNRSLSLQNMINMFLNDNHPWRTSSYNIYQTKLNSYLKHGYSSNPSSKAMTIRCLNRMCRWGYEYGYMSNLKKIKGGDESLIKSLTRNLLKFISLSVHIVGFNTLNSYQAVLADYNYDYYVDVFDIVLIVDNILSN